MLFMRSYKQTPTNYKQGENGRKAQLNPAYLEMLLSIGSSIEHFEKKG